MTNGMKKGKKERVATKESNVKEKQLSTSEKLPKNDCNKCVAANTLKTEKLDETAIKR